MPTAVDDSTLTLPSLRDWEKLLQTGDTAGPYIVIVYDDDWHTIEDVIFQVQKATGCTVEKARKVTMEVHHKGRAVAYSGSQEQCEEVATILREIKLQVETDSAR